MSWSKTYTHTLAIALDQFAAAILFNRADLTISALCWIVLASASPYASTTVDYNEGAVRSLAALNLYAWQKSVLRFIGVHLLERFWPGHCVAARQGDAQRAAQTIGLLS